MLWGWPKPSPGLATTEGPTGLQSWPNYEAAYLAKRLGHAEPTDAYRDRYKAGDEPPVEGVGIEDPVARQVYLERVTNDFRQEADECLKSEFVDWLQGAHEDNRMKAEWQNRPGLPKRKTLFTVGDRVAGEQLDDWKPTWWGTNQLTHLPGVRPFLRDKKESAADQEFYLNQLAEFGPQNIEQAWQYF